jgi:hypothetical protein
MGNSSKTGNTSLVTSEVCTVPSPLVTPIVLLLKSRQLISTSSTRRVTSEEWEFPPPLIAAFLHLKYGQFPLN